MLKKLLIFACVFALFSCSDESDEQFATKSQQKVAISSDFVEFTKFVTSKELWTGPFKFVDRDQMIGYSCVKQKFSVAPDSPETLIVTNVKTNETTTWVYVGEVTTKDGKKAAAMFNNDRVWYIQWYGSFEKIDPEVTGLHYQIGTDSLVLGGSSLEE